MHEVIAKKSSSSESAKAGEIQKTIDSLPNSDGFGYNKVQDMFNLAYGFVGLIAVVFIIYGAVTYVTSAGNPAKIQKAKSAIIWSVIGLVVVLLAAAITWFVIENINNAG